MSHLNLKGNRSDSNSIPTHTHSTDAASVILPMDDHSHQNDNVEPLPEQHLGRKRPRRSLRFLDPFDLLSSVECQLIFQFLSNSGRLCVGRCSRRMLKEMMSPFAWKFATLPRFEFNLDKYYLSHPPDCKCHRPSEIIRPYSLSQLAPCFVEFHCDNPDILPASSPPADFDDDDDHTDDSGSNGMRFKSYVRRAVAATLAAVENRLTEIRRIELIEIKNLSWLHIKCASVVLQMPAAQYTELIALDISVPSALIDTLSPSRWTLGLK